MPNETLTELLTSAATEILETMFFICPEAVSAPEQWGSFHTGASLDFKGERTGKFEILLDRDLAKEMTAGFLGATGPGEVGPEQVNQVACELANMVCGVTLSRMSPGAIFSLATPAPETHGQSTSFESDDGSGHVIGWLDSGSGLMRLALALDPVEERS